MAKEKLTKKALTSRLDAKVSSAGLNYASTLLKFGKTGEVGRPSQEYLEEFKSGLLELAFVSDARAQLDRAEKTKSSSNDELAWVAVARAGLRRCAHEHKETSGLDRTRLFSPKLAEHQQVIRAEMLSTRVGYPEIATTPLEYAAQVAAGAVVLELPNSGAGRAD